MSTLIHGAGVTEMIAVCELRKWCYSVQVFEHSRRPGGLNRSLQGGGRYTEAGGFARHRSFDKGLYLNPKPWRIPHHHKTLIGYCKQFFVVQKSRNQRNLNALLQYKDVSGGRSQRYRVIDADLKVNISELVVKCGWQPALNAHVSTTNLEPLPESLRNRGASDRIFTCVKAGASRERRGFLGYPGEGSSGQQKYSKTYAAPYVLRHRMRPALAVSNNYAIQTSTFQSVGGAGQIGVAIACVMDVSIHYNAKIIAVDKNISGLSVTWQDASNSKALLPVTMANCGVCTIAQSILRPMPLTVGEAKNNAIATLPYVASVKAGFQLMRRFWQGDEFICVGIGYADRPSTMISYFSTDYHSSGNEVLLRGYTWRCVPADSLQFQNSQPDLAWR